MPYAILICCALVLWATGYLSGLAALVIITIPFGLVLAYFAIAVALMGIKERRVARLRRKADGKW